MSNIPPHIQTIVNLLKGNDRDSKILAIKAAAILKHTCFVPILIDLIEIVDEHMAIEIIKALASIANAEAINCLLDFIASENKNISRAIINALSTIKPQILLEPILKLITRKNTFVLNTNILKELLKLIISINDSRVTVLFSEFITKSKENIILVESLKHFIIFPSIERISLIRMLTGHSSWEVNIAALVALSRINDLEAYNHIKKSIKSNATSAKNFVLDLLNLNPLPSDKELYEILIHDDDVIIREKAIEGLKIFKLEDRIKLLKSRLKQENDNSLRFKLLKLASNEANIAFYSEFIAILDSSSNDEQEIARFALINMGEKIIPHLLEDIKKSSLVLKEKIVNLIGKISIKNSKIILDVYNTLVNMLDSSERWLKINSIEALSNVPLPLPQKTNLIQKLNNLLKADSDSWIKATVITALGKLGGQVEKEIISEYLSSNDPRVRANAVEAIGKLGISDKVEKVKAMLSDPNDRVRANAAIILYKNGYVDVIFALKEMLTKGTKWVKASAAYACGEIHCKDLVNDLIELLNDKEDVVYKNAIEALAKIGDVRALLPLLKEFYNNRLSIQKLEEIHNKYIQNLQANLI